METTIEFKNMKFRVKDEEHSKQIQEHLFSLGYNCLCQSNNEYQNFKEPYLFTDTDGRISWCNSKGYFEGQDEIKEYQLKETKSYALEEVKPKSKIGDLTVKVNLELTVNGEKVSLDRLEDVISKLDITDVVKFKVGQ